MFYSIAFERFELGSSRIRLIQIPFKDMPFTSYAVTSLIQYLIYLETDSNPGSNPFVHNSIWNVHELRQEHMKRLRGSRGSPFIWHVYEPHRGRSRGSRGSPSIWNIVETNRLILHCIRTFLFICFVNHC